MAKVEKVGVAGEEEVKVKFNAQKDVEKKENEKGTYHQSVWTDKKGKLQTSCVLGATEKYPWKFGIRKAHLIAENIKAIRYFAADHPEEGASKPIVPEGKLIKRTNEEGVSYITKAYTEGKTPTPMIVLDHESRYPFQFGPAKARQIVTNAKAIRAFCLDHPKTQDEEEG